MNPKHNPQSDASNEPQLPPELVRDLRALYPYPATPAAEIETAVRSDAREQIGNLRRHRRWGLWGSIAACVGFVFIMQQVMRTSTTPPSEDREMLAQKPAPLSAARRTASEVAVAQSPTDIDGNGRVDILDAYVLARRLADDNAIPDPRWDINADGAIDQRDIDAVAQLAVRLKGGA